MLMTEKGVNEFQNASRKENPIKKSNPIVSIYKRTNNIKVIIIIFNMAASHLLIFSVAALCTMVSRKITVILNNVF